MVSVTIVSLWWKTPNIQCPVFPSQSPYGAFSKKNQRGYQNVLFFPALIQNGQEGELYQAFAGAAINTLRVRSSVNVANSLSHAAR